MEQVDQKIKIIESFKTYYASPLGWMGITVTADAVEEVIFCEKKEEDDNSGPREVPAVMKLCIDQLDAYFEGTRKQFELPLFQKGSSFQQQVWKELLNIPFGSTISYLELSKRIGNVKSIRAAAATNGRNRIAVIVPCHRVIGSDQTLVGYAGGLSKKRWLLDHERKFAHGLQTLF